MTILRVILFSFLFTATTFAENNLKAGVVLPLSGMVASMGQAVSRGLEIYRADNTEKLKNVTFIIEDSKYDGKETSKIINKLITTDKVDIIYVWGVTPGEITTPIAGQKNVPTIIATYLTESTKFKSIVDLGPSEEACLEPMINYLTKGENSAAHDYGAVSIDVGSAVTALNTIDKKTGYVMPREVIPTEMGDFKSILTKFKNKKIKRILLFLFPDQALSFLRQAKDLNYEFTAIGGDIFAEQKFFTEAKKINPNLYISYGRIAPFLETKYREKYNDASYLSEVGYGYSFGMLSAALVDKKARLNGETFHALLTELPISELPLKNPRLTTGPNGYTRIESSYELIDPQ